MSNVSKYWDCETNEWVVYNEGLNVIQPTVTKFPNHVEVLLHGDDEVLYVSYAKARKNGWIK